MHVPTDSGLLLRMASWLRPRGRLLLEEPDFGMWMADADPLWATHPNARHQAFPNGSLSRGRWLLAQIPTLERAAQAGFAARVGPQVTSLQAQLASWLG